LREGEAAMTKRIWTIAIGMMAAVPSAAVALPISETIKGKEALLFTTGLSIFTLGLFAIYLVGALWQKRS
jgi:predicted membrane channel-forming protein YqfA (hemolysin III family)